jgi:hypothetical protein
MDYTRNERQEAQRKRDKTGGLELLQLKLPAEVKEILRREAKRKGMNLGQYCRERLGYLSGKILEREAAQQPLPECEKPKTMSAPVAAKSMQPIAQPQLALTPENRAALLAVLDAMTPRPDISGNKG